MDWLLCALITHTVHHLDQRTHHTRVCCHSQISSHPTDIQHSQLWSLVSAILCSARQSSCLYSHVNLMRWLTGLNQKSPNLFDFKLIPATVYRWIFIYVFFFLLFLSANFTTTSTASRRQNVILPQVGDIPEAGGTTHSDLNRRGAASVFLPCYPHNIAVIARRGLVPTVMGAACATICEV